MRVPGSPSDASYSGPSAAGDVDRTLNRVLLLHGCVANEYCGFWSVLRNWRCPCVHGRHRPLARVDHQSRAVRSWVHLPQGLVNRPQKMLVEPLDRARLNFRGLNTAP